MDFCPRCGAGVIDGMKRCHECRKPIPAARKSGIAEELPRPEEKRQAGVFDSEVSKGKSRSVKEKKNKIGIRIWLKVVIAIVVIASAIYSSLSEEEGSNVSEAPDYIPEISVSEDKNFFECEGVGESVYADIVSIFPAYKIYEEENVYTDFACECVSESGETLWIFISISDYVKYFNSEAWDSIHSDYADEISFPVRRIHGVRTYADDIIDNFSEDIGTDVLIDFIFAD